MNTHKRWHIKKSDFFIQKFFDIQLIYFKRNIHKNKSKIRSERLLKWSIINFLLANDYMQRKSSTCTEVKILLKTRQWWKKFFIPFWVIYINILCSIRYFKNKFGLIMLNHKALVIEVHKRAIIHVCIIMSI